VVGTFATTTRCSCSRCCQLTSSRYPNGSAPTSVDVPHITSTL
jgi:hypothetical protein